ncbi:MAG: transglutaminase-like domain-containing protein, partial [Mycobacteriales bacterium]
VRVSYDPTTASLVSAQGLRPGLRYAVESRRPDFDVGKLSNAALSDAAEIRQYANVPANLPDRIVSLASDIIAPAATPYSRALLIEQWLLQQLTFSAEASSGHGLANLDFFLTVVPEQGGQRGTSEQFATAFALLARIAGLPTRVSVGFHAGTPQADGRFMVTTGDAFAWPEVYFVGQGWVPFDPSPRPDDSAPIPPDQATPEAQQRNRAKAKELRELENPDSEPSSDGLSADTSGQATGEKVLNIGLIAGVCLAILLLLLLLAVLIGRKLLRRKRLSAPDRPQRVIGAWEHVVDAMRLARHRPPPHLTSHEVAELAATLTPRHPQPLPPLYELATVVNAIEFAPDLSLAPHADQAVAAAREYARVLQRRQRWFRRVLWPLRPGPLLWVRSRTAERERAATARLQRQSRPAPLNLETLSAQLVWAPARSVHTVSEKAS